MAEGYIRRRRVSNAVREGQYKRNVCEGLAMKNHTFTKWVNAKLAIGGFEPISELCQGLSDGIKLMQLMHVLTNAPIPKHNKDCSLRAKALENVTIALDMVRRLGVSIRFLHSNLIVDRNEKMVLALIWAIIRTVSLDSIGGIDSKTDSAQRGNSTVEVGTSYSSSSSSSRIEARLLTWVKRSIQGIEPTVKVNNFSSDWNDGKVLCYLLHSKKKAAIDISKLSEDDPEANVELGLATAEKEFKVPRLVTTEELSQREPDNESVLTYVATMYQSLREIGIVDNTHQGNEEAEENRKKKEEEEEEEEKKEKEHNQQQAQQKLFSEIEELKAKLGRATEALAEETRNRVEAEDRGVKLDEGTKATRSGVEETSGRNRTTGKLTLIAAAKQNCKKAATKESKAIDQMIKEFRKKPKHKQYQDLLSNVNYKCEARFGYRKIRLANVKGTLMVRCGGGFQGLFVERLLGASVSAINSNRAIAMSITLESFCKQHAVRELRRYSDRRTGRQQQQHPATGVPTPHHQRNKNDNHQKDGTAATEGKSDTISSSVTAADDGALERGTGEDAQRNTHVDGDDDAFRSSSSSTTTKHIEPSALSE
eukprot:jgi/Bigna1/129176/aug1.8_g3884